MIYLDYAKAFDKVDHGVLLNKLKTFGICGKLGEWLQSFLTNSRHHVRIPGGVSKSDNVLSGVLLFASSSNFLPLINPVIPGLDRQTPRSCLLACSTV